MKKKPLYTLLSLLIVLALAVPVWSTVVRADTSTEIFDWHDLHDIRDDLGGDYVLMTDLDSTTAGYDDLAGPDAHDGKGWEPIGTSANPFSGTFHGQGYEIRDLVITRPTHDFVGLFGWVDGPGEVEAVGLMSANLTGRIHVGGLVGRNDGSVSSSYFAGSVNATNYVGGLVGQNFGTVTSSHSTGVVTGNPQDSGGVYVGGLIGRNTDTGTVNESYSTACVTGRDYVGGLVGYNWKGTVSRCHTGGNVTGVSRVGGLVGQNESGGTVSNSHSTANSSGADMVGGLTGSNMGTVSNSYSVGSAAGTNRVGGLSGDNGGTVSSSYATGSVIGDLSVGGLVGQNDGTVSRCYATGSIGGNNHVGGLLGWDSGGTVTDSYSTGAITRVSGSATTLGGFVGRNDQGKIINCYSTGSVRYQEPNPDPTDKGFAGSINTGGDYEMSGNFWDMQTSGQSSTASGATGKTTEDMMDISTFIDAGWDIAGVGDPDNPDPSGTWNIVQAGTYPFLVWQYMTIHEIRNWHDLDAVRSDVAGYYMLMNDLDYTTNGYDALAGPTANDGRGWQPIGTAVDPFAGTFDGQVYEVRDLFVIRPDEDYVGLFGVIQGGGVANIGVVDVDVTGNDYVGALVGDNSEGSVTNSYSSGTVIGNSFVGGLTGISDGIIFTSCSFVSVVGELWVGGLVGSNVGNVSNCYATGSVSGDWGVGGLVGDNFEGLVMKSYSSSEVTGNQDAGGLVGAEEDGTVSDSFWDMDTSGTNQSAGGTPKTTVQMQAIATFTDTATEGLDDPWDIISVPPGTTHPDHTWNIVDTQTYPFLSWQDPVGAQGALILGQTREVNCATLSGVTVTAYLNDEPVNSTISDIAGNYELTVPQVGEYQVVASKDGFRDETRWINVEDLEDEYDLHFRSDHGLIPNAPDLFYVLDCIDLWLYPPGNECGLTLFRVLDVIDAWLYPIIESE